MQSGYAMDILLHSYIVREMSTLIDIRCLETFLFSHGTKLDYGQYFIQVIGDDK